MSDQQARRQRRHPAGRRHTTVRLSDEEETQLRALAGAAGLSLPRYLVECGLRGGAGGMLSLRTMRQLGEQLGTALVRLHRSGGALNQIAARLHATGELEHGELAAALTYHRQTLDLLRSALQGVRW